MTSLEGLLIQVSLNYDRQQKSDILVITFEGGLEHSEEYFTGTHYMEYET